jgi:hypothetical protein
MGVSIKRPYRGKRRSHAVANSSQLDSWVLNNASRRAKDRELVNTIVRNRALRAETRKANVPTELKICLAL